tara:strand:- start:185 stop:943 length:759 start_codon:yes stop_codon:yes gene_type:complete
MERIENPNGHYDFLTGISAFSSGVRAHAGFEIVRVVFERPVFWSDGFDIVERALDGNGSPSTSLCSIELRCSEPYSAGGFDDFNETYVERLLSMGVFERGQPNPVGRTNVAPIDRAPDQQSMYAFSYTREATTDRAVSFVIAGGGEVRGGEINDQTIVRYGETTPDAIEEKASFVLMVMEKRLNGLGLEWSHVRDVSVYTKHPIDSGVRTLISEQVGSTSLHGIHLYRTAPPVEHIEFEMDVKGPTWQEAHP